MSKLDNKNISKHLGQSSQYKSEYDASLLVREPRSSNRKHLKIKEKTLPFVGCDVWNGYEVSALTNNGVPVCGAAKVVYPANSKYIVESKSMKLYWNTFNMTKMGDTFDRVVKNIEDTASKDLSKYLRTDVKVVVFPTGDSFNNTNPYNDRNYKRLENTDEIDADSFYVDVYNETPSLLKTKYPNSTNKPYKAMSSLLKSNCRVTSQPDWGDVFIHLEGTNYPSDKELLKYIISFRDECHFHEEICETIFTRLKDTFDPRVLAVACLYVRRGGWDINPIRTTHEHLMDEFFWDENIPWIKTLRQ